MSMQPKHGATWPQLGTAKGFGRGLTWGWSHLCLENGVVHVIRVTGTSRCVSILGPELHFPLLEGHVHHWGSAQANAQGHRNLLT